MIQPEGFDSTDESKVCRLQRSIYGLKQVLVQNSIEVGEAGAGMTAAAIETCKESLNQSWGCSGKTLRCSSQYSASTEMDCSSRNFGRVSR